jgi:chemotaxis signal transduction protein
MTSMLLVLCHAGGNLYAFEAHCVSEVVPRVALHRVAHAPPWHVGLLIHRGLTTPVVDLAHLATGEACPARLSSRIVVLHADFGGAPRRFGILAERVDLREADAPLDAQAVAAANRTAWGRLVLDAKGAYELVDLARLLAGDRWDSLFPTAEQGS